MKFSPCNICCLKAAAPATTPPFDAYYFIRIRTMVSKPRASVYTCALLRAYLPMTRNTSATSIKPASNTTICYDGAVKCTTPKKPATTTT